MYPYGNSGRQRVKEQFALVINPDKPSISRRTVLRIEFLIWSRIFVQDFVTPGPTT